MAADTGRRGLVLSRILFDVEGDGLLPELTKIHCICCVDVDTEETRDFGPDELGAAVRYLSDADVLVAHFGIGYDFPALEKVLGFVVPPDRQLDTFILASLKFPNIKELDASFNKGRIAKGKPSMGDQFGRHTIEAWGIRLNCVKLHTEIEDWSKWTPEIQERCHGDVQTNLKLWKRLDPDKMSQDAIALEHRVRRLTNMITEAGWPFNVKKAGLLHAELLDEKHKVEQQLIAQFGGWYRPLKTTKTKDKAGNIHITPAAFTPKRDDKKKGYVKDAPCTKIEWHVFNPGSRPDIERCLRTLGWEPDEFTETGAPKLDEEQLDGIATRFEQAQGLTRYLMLSKRLGQLATGKKAWLNFVDKQGLIHGCYNPLGAVTSRAVHFDPNLGQVPAVGIEYGEECRSLFGVLEGFELLGADKEGLEGRCQAHYMAKHDGGAFGEVVLSGDVHWENVLALGLAEGERITDEEHHLYKLHKILRDSGSKRWYYAWIYGSGKEESGRIIMECIRAVVKLYPKEGAELWEKFFGSQKAPGPRALSKVGGRLQDTFFEKIPALGAVIRKVKGAAVTRQCLPGLDGRIVPVRSEHSAFNALLQSAGAILCKRWMVDAYDALIAAGYKWGWKGDFVIVGWIHDELQIAVRKGLSEKVGAIVVKAAQEAGKPYGFRIRLDSSYKVGANWAVTH